MNKFILKNNDYEKKQLKKNLPLLDNGIIVTPPSDGSKYLQGSKVCFIAGTETGAEAVQAIVTIEDDYPLVPAAITDKINTTISTLPQGTYHARFRIWVFPGGYRYSPVNIFHVHGG